MNHIINFYKPRGLSSTQTTNQIKKMLGIKKIGYAGTLDPVACGVLIVGTNDATKALTSLTNVDKTYEVKILFGVQTDTCDITGEVTEISYHYPTATALVKLIEKYQNYEYLQTPPQFSAIKINGVRAYKMARKKINVPLQPRWTKIYRCELLEFKLPVISLRLHVAKGFYVRSFVNELAAQLQTVATMLRLIRVQCGNYCLNQTVCFADLENHDGY